MKTLVTGATGLIGFNIVQSLLRRKRDVRVLARSTEKARRLLPQEVEVVEGDLLEPETIQGAMHGCEVVYHAAGLPEQWLADKATFERVNAEGTRNMVQAAQEHHIRRFVYTSTIDVFRGNKGEPFDESIIDAEPKGTPYERSKQCAYDLVVKAFEDGLDVVTLHPSAVYGPGPAGSPGLNQFIVRICRHRLPSLVPGGMAVVFSEDVGEGHVRAEERAGSGAGYILSESYRNLREIARTVADVAEVKWLPPTIPLWMARGVAVAGEAVSRVIHRPPLVPRGQLHFMQWNSYPRNDKARQELDMEFTPFVEGVRRTLEAQGLIEPRPV